MSVIIAVDFDGTLHLGKFPNIGEPNTLLIDCLRDAMDAGAYIILWTCRSGASLCKATEWCTLNGFRFDAVNENVAEMAEGYSIDSRKVYADLYIDDKAPGYSTEVAVESIREAMK